MKKISFFLCREWYGYHFPELVKIVSDNYLYAQVVKLIGDRKAFDVSKIEELEVNGPSERLFDLHFARKMGWYNEFA